MTQQKIKFYTSIVVCLCLVLGLFVFFVNLSVTSLVRQDIFLPDQLPDTYQTAIILGAKVYSNGGLSGMTQDRADTAISLYQKQKITKLLVSGDHGQKNYDEVNSIKDYLLSKGIPKANIYLDHAGFDTYDSIYRARDILRLSLLSLLLRIFICLEPFI